MRYVLPLIAMAATGCGDDTRSAGLDAADSNSMTVRLVAPNGGETLYPAEPFVVSWETMGGSSVTYEVTLVEASSTGSLATALTSPTFTWTPSGVAAPTSYRLRVTATDASGASVSDESDAPFTVAPPLTGTSLARDVQPIFSANCLDTFCHTTASQSAQLHLAPGATYKSLVGRNSVENPCTSYPRVKPGMPDASYLIFKLAGTGPCLYGVRMPKDKPALSAGNIATIRAWITEGARDN